VERLVDVELLTLEVVELVLVELVVDVVVLDDELLELVDDVVVGGAVVVLEDVEVDVDEEVEEVDVVVDVDEEVEVVVDVVEVLVVDGAVLVDVVLLVLVVLLLDVDVVVVPLRTLSMCSRADCVGFPPFRSQACAVRWPLPVTSSTRALPLVQPGPPTICWTIGDRSGVRWAAPWSPIVVHAGTAHVTEAAVRDRALRLAAAVVKLAALLVASPAIVRVVASLCVSSTQNCT